MAELSWDTPTMAELFAKQGHVRRAAAIYRKVVRESPENERARSRLAELEAALHAKSSEQGERNMSFRAEMQRIVESTPGAIACVVMGFDGIAIDSYEVGGGEFDIPTLVIEYSAAAQQLKRAVVEQPVGGAFVEMAFTGEKLSMLLRPLTDEYFMAVVLSTSGYAGKARFLMRVAAPKIAQELT